MYMNIELVLASNSIRRREILERTGIDFSLDAADIDENLGIDDPEELVRELSYRKAASVAPKHRGKAVLGADTIVVLGKDILGKPKDEEDAFQMLSKLSGNTHKVYTGVTILKLQDKEPPVPEELRDTFCCMSEVTMYELEPELIRSYIATGEPMDKAGSYGIQDIGAILIKEIRGSYHNVVGLPIGEVWRHLKEFL